MNKPPLFDHHAMTANQTGVLVAVCIALLIAWLYGG
jgi:hypothetical protein